MANFLYVHAYQGFLDGSINWTNTNGQIQAYLVSSAYIPDIDNHVFVSDLGSNIIGPQFGVPVTPNTAQGSGIADAADPDWGTIATVGQNIAHVVIAKTDAGHTDGSTPADDRLIVHWDVIPNITTTGGDMSAAFQHSNTYVFKL